MNDLQIHTRFSSIRNFVYVNHDIWPSDLPQLITSLEHLDSLSISLITPRDDAEMTDYPVVPGEHALPHLRTLRLRTVNPLKWSTWILSLPGYTPQIQALDIAV